MDLGFISLRVTATILKMVFSVFLLGLKHKKGSVEKMPSHSLVVSLGNAKRDFPHFFVTSRWQGETAVVA